MVDGRQVLRTIVDAALEAGAEIARIYAVGCEIEEKADGSPVTIADRAAEGIILARLLAAYPDIPVLAEEEASEGRIPELGKRFFLIDPLDGTKGFAQRNGEFTVNIALIEDGGPVAHESIRPRPRPTHGLTAIGSRNHHAQGTEDRLAALGVTDFVPSGSSLKFCLLAEGTADVYARYGTTMEWDTGAGQAVLEAAGGRVMVLDGTAEAGPLRYGKKESGFANPHFIAWGV